MLILYGTEACTSCKQAAMLLSKTPLEWRYIDVAKIAGWVGDIPALKIDDDNTLIGLPAINQYVALMGF